MQKELIHNALYRLEEQTLKIEQCFEELSEEEVWRKPNASSNCVANLILHMCGNLTQYVISSLGDRPDLRERDLEFSTNEGYTKSMLLKRIHETVAQAREVLEQVSEAELLRVRGVQGYQFSGVGNVVHAVEHYSYHTGQIAFWVKLLKDKDLGFYKEVDLNERNES